MRKFFRLFLRMTKEKIVKFSAFHGQNKSVYIYNFSFIFSNHIMLLLYKKAFIAYDIHNESIFTLTYDKVPLS